MCGIVGDGVGQRHAIYVQLGHEVDRYQLVGDLQSGGVRKEGECMAICTHAKEDEGEAGRLPRLECERLAELALIRAGRLLRRQLGRHAVDLLLAEVATRQKRVEQCLACHTVVTLRVVWRHTAVVTPVELDRCPIDCVMVRGCAKQSMERAGCGAAREGDGEAPLRSSARLANLHKEVRRGMGHSAQVVGDHQLRSVAGRLAHTLPLRGFAFSNWVAAPSASSYMASRPMVCSCSARGCCGPTLCRCTRCEGMELSGTWQAVVALARSRSRAMVKVARWPPSLEAM